MVSYSYRKIQWKEQHVLEGIPSRVEVVNVPEDSLTQRDEDHY